MFYLYKDINGELVNISYPKLKKDISSLEILMKFWSHMTRKRKLQIKLLIFLMLLNGFSEIISIGSLLPYLTAITNINLILDNSFFQKIAPILGITTNGQLIFWMTIFFSFSILITTTIRLLNIWFTGRISASIGSEFATKAYGRTLYQSYSFHLNKNSSDLIASLTQQTDITISVLESTLLLISGLIILLSILFTLFYIDWQIAIILISLFSFFYYIFKAYNHRKLELNGEKIDFLTKGKIKSINEGFGSVKDTLLQNNQRIYINNFRNKDKPYRLLNAQNSFLFSSPRFVIEAFGLALISFIAYITIQSKNNPSEVIPILGAIALGTQKLLPTSQLIYSSWATITGCKASLISVLKLMELSINQSFKTNSSVTNYAFNKLTFKNVFFSYNENNKFVLRNLNFTIKKGDKIGFIGSTGSGKTTTVDLIMTLLHPSQGQLILDGKVLNKNKNINNLIKWRKSIAHVPQNIFLNDSTIIENIAFGIPKNEINFLKVKESAEKANLNYFIDSLPNGYNTRVGERGTQLSGGQAQRIAIARSFYKEASVLVLDEATSALDNKTERDIMDSINAFKKDLTIIIIAHRLSTVQNCNRIFEFSNGVIINEFNKEEFAKKFNL